MNENNMDYKNYITQYLDENIQWWNNGINNTGKKILHELSIFNVNDLKPIFQSEDHILKFFWYKLLTRENMPANGFDCDKVFFGKVDLIPVSDMMTDWQKKKLNENWTPDTINSFSQLFKNFLILYLPEVFAKSNGSLVILAGKYDGPWTKNLLEKISDEKIKRNVNNKLNKLNNIIYQSASKSKNELVLYSYYILLNEVLINLLEKVCINGELEEIKTFAKLTHTYGNFILLPKYHNKLKNDDYGDFIDLYIASKQKDENEELIKEQSLNLYLGSMLFNRKVGGKFPHTKELSRICIANVNNRITERVKLISSNPK